MRSTYKNKYIKIKQYRLAMTKIKPSIVVIYISIFLLVIAMVFLGYHEPQNASEVANATKLNLSNVNINQTSVNDVVATNVAANVAQITDLPIAPNVTNLAISTKTLSDFEQSISSNEIKPQIIISTATNRLVTSYSVKEGEDVNVLSARFGISKDTIKFANNLINDTLTVGQVLQILPIDGVLYTVKSGDTIDSIATKYSIDKTRLVLYNDLDVSGLVPSTKIILPSGTLPANERPGYVAPVIINYYAGQSTGFGGSTFFISYGTGPCPTYGYGQCTCYAYARRVQLGLPVGTHWGNAVSWAYNASSAGLVVNRTPSAGAIIQNGGGYGHVGIVDSVDSNGNVRISEMNAYVSGGGWNIVSGRTLSAGNASSYMYIH